MISQRRREILEFLSKNLNKGLTIVGYGASAKATVLLNYISFSNSEIAAIADQSPLKQGKYIPGVAIPIVSFDQLKRLNPDLIILFAWNLRNEIIRYLNRYLRKEALVVTFMPQVSIKKLNVRA